MLTHFRPQLSLLARPLSRSLATPSTPGSPTSEPINIERGPSRTPYVFGIVALSMIGAYWLIRDTPLENGQSTKMEKIMEPIVESNKGNRN